MLLTGRFRRMSVWLWSTPAAGRLLVIVRPDHSDLLRTMRSLFAGEEAEVEVVLDRRRRDRRGAAWPYQADHRRAERRQRDLEGRDGDASILILRESHRTLDRAPGSQTMGDGRMMGVESEQVRDGDEVRCWLEAGQTQLAALMELLHEHERLRERVEVADREHEWRRGVTYEIEQLRNKFETSERQGEQLREEVGKLRAELERSQELVESAQRERNELREKVGKLGAENDQLQMEQAEAGETAAKLLSEMKELVNRVADKFPRPPRMSPFTRDPRPPAA
jgi:hypothetical protein